MLHFYKRTKLSKDLKLLPNIKTTVAHRRKQNAGSKANKIQNKFATWHVSHVNGLILAACGVKNTKDTTYTKAKVIEVWVCRIGKRKQSLAIYGSCFICIKNAAFHFVSFIVYLISLLVCCLSLYSWKLLWVTEEDPTINSKFIRHIFPESRIGVLLWYVYSLFHIVV